MRKKSMLNKLFIGLFGLSIIAAISFYLINRASIPRLDTKHLFEDELTEYIIPQRPSSKLSPGTIISYIDGNEFVEANSEICFRSDKATIRTADTVFQSKSYSTSIKTGIGFWFFRTLFSNSSKDQIKLVSSGVSNVSVKFGDAKINYIELVQIRNLISAIDTSALCRSALKNGSMIIVEAITISSAEININQTVGDNQAILVEWNNETGLSTNGKISSIGKANLDLNTPLSIGYKIVSLESLPVRAAIQIVERPVGYYYSLRDSKI
jgi:hypothetical protein